MFKRVAGSFVFLVVFLSSFAVVKLYVDDKTEQNIISSDRYSGYETKNEQMTKDLVKFLDLDIDNEYVLSRFCELNNLDSCDVDEVLDIEKTIGNVEIKGEPLDYYNTMVYLSMSDRFYVDGDVDRAIKAMVLSAYYTEILTGNDSRMYEIAMSKLANMIDMKKKESQ